MYHAFLSSLIRIRHFDCRSADDVKASLKKSRRHVLRRTISVAIAGLLGAGLMASSVIAQQLSTLSGKPSGQSVSTDKAGGDNSSRTPIDDQVYGLSTTRGTRYLLRNGLDYLNYKEYDRA